MRIFKNAWFNRFARREKISDAVLEEAVARAGKGAIDAILGGGVIKQRPARPGEGKSGGFRSIILFRERDRALFVYGFAKSDRDNIEPDEMAAFKKSAKTFFSLTEAQISVLLEEETLAEVPYEE